ncbi:RIP metalloprotease RseP [Candidatus Microgenomates bacterium]|jgi:regulator of sigma E protease|nr:MAG: RIP metalloprotease RseP [Candidatus Microgenomates bacterium]
MTLIIFILILSVLVFIHELGHFIAAKKAGILVEEFGFGLPPRIWGKKVGETIYSINALPIGGFVRLFGENGEQAETAEKIEKAKGRAFFEKSLFKRFSVLVGGVTMNVLLAIVVFSILYFIYGIPTKTGEIKILAVSSGSPASEIGLMPEDKIISVDGREFNEIDSFVEYTTAKAGEEVELTVARENESQVYRVVPRKEPPEGEGPLGVAISDTELKKYPAWQMPYLGVREGFKESINWGKMILTSLKDNVLLRLVKGEAPSKDLAGPVGIYQITGQVKEAGFLALLQFLGILSVNLAIINILPFPALDGGRLVFLGYEAIFRKKVNPKIEVWANSIGMALLLALMLLITINDVARLVRN